MLYRKFLRLASWSCLILIGVVLPSFGQTQARAPDYATIMRGLEAHPGQLRSVFARYTCVQGISGSYAATNKAPSDYGLQNETNVEWAFKGPKYYEKVTDTKGETQQNDHQRYHLNKSGDVIMPLPRTRRG